MLKLIYYPKSNTRGNKYKLLNHTFHYDTRKYSFFVGIVNIWNSLSNNSVVDVDTVCLFKAHLGKMLNMILRSTGLESARAQYMI